MKGAARLRHASAYKDQLKRATKEAEAGRYLKKAQDQLTAKRYAGARRMFKDVMRRYPDTQAAMTAELTLQEMASKKDIVAVLQQADADRKGKSLLSMGRNYARMGAKRKAKTYLQKVIDNYPDSEWAAPARRERGSLGP